MPTSSRPSQSTRLENFRLEGERVWLDLDGQPVELTGDDAAPAVQSFQAFYQTAQHAYQAVPDRSASSPAQAPWWRRLRTWLAEWVGGTRRSSAAVQEPSAIAKVSAATETSALGANRATSGAATVDTRPPPVLASQSPHPSKTPTASAAPSAAPPVRSPTPVPLLRAAFADEKGVHLIWSHPAASGSKAETELIYGFDSPVAAGLQACYGQLAAIGHAVVDLGAWQAAPTPAPSPAATTVPRAPTPGPSPTPATSPQTAASAASPAPAAAGPVPPSSVPVKSSAVKPGAEPSAADHRYLKLSPQRSEMASRLVVIPAEGDPRPEVITGAETFFNALHAAADAGVPEADRLTFLKCRPVKGELKVVELGFGRKAGAATEPARTESAAAWWKQAQKLREAETTPPSPRPDGPTAAAPQAELFGK